MLDRSAILKNLNRAFEQLLPLLAVPLALIVGAFILLALKVDPIKSYAALLDGIFGSVFGLTQNSRSGHPPVIGGPGRGDCLSRRGT